MNKFLYILSPKIIINRIFGQWTEFLLQLITTLILVGFASSIQSLLLNTFRNFYIANHWVMIAISISYITILSLGVFLGVFISSRKNSEGYDDKYVRKLLNAKFYEYFRHYKKNKSLAENDSIIYIGVACTHFFKLEILEGIRFLLTSNTINHIQENDNTNNSKFNKIHSIKIFCLDYENLDLMNELEKRESNVKWDDWHNNITEYRTKLVDKEFWYNWFYDEPYEIADKITDYFSEINQIKNCYKNKTKTNLHQKAIKAQYELINDLSKLLNNKISIEVHRINKIPEFKIWFFPNVGGYWGTYSGYISKSQFGNQRPWLHFSNYKDTSEGIYEYISSLK